MTVVRSPLRDLIENLIDYAGLFPPASLSMSASVRNYAAYRRHEWNGVLGRCIVPTTQIDEFERETAGLGDGWAVSALGAPSRLKLNCGVIDTIELKARTAGEIHDLPRMADVITYIEIPTAEDPGPLLEAIRQVGARAKIRTGGITPDLFPPSEDIARFLIRCVSAGIPFKATAGLHHPIRARHKLTYELDSISGVMHGFLNVFLAAALVHHGGREQAAVRTLEETSPRAFTFDEDAVRWHDHCLTSDQIRETRRTFAISFGSCSFEEPLDDLRTLELL